MPRWELSPEEGGPPVELPRDRAVIVGRAIVSDLHLTDETVSRHHAELAALPDGVRVRDLSSANGTLLNDAAVTDGTAHEGDVISFGRVRFRVVLGAASEPRGTETAGPEELPEGTSVRALDVRSGEGPLGRLARDRLARLVDLARRLGEETEGASLPSLIVEQAAALLPVDRVALLTARQGEDELRVRHWANRLGRATVMVPRSIVKLAIEQRNPVVTGNALADRRFQSGSVVRERVRAALCVPLLAGESEVLGALYLDSLTATQPFSEEDAALAFAFGGLAAASLGRARAAEVSRRQGVVRANFERFFAPGVAAHIAGTRSEVRPGGARAPVTVLFSDLRGFTGLAETMDPEALARHLSDYYSAMVELVFEHGGTLDKFMGDALLAVWGAPVAGGDDTDRALAAARAMQAECRELTPRWHREGRPPLAIGIGLHHGEAFTGTVGSPRRLEYTVLGDVVNVAARLCDAAAAGEIVMSGETLARLAAPPAVPPGEPLQLRGREQPVTVYRLREDS